MVDKHRSRLAEIQKARLAGLRSLAEEMGRQSITIEANANDEGHLYGSVGAHEIVSALKKNNIAITPDQVRLEGPLKELGLYTVKIHLGHDIDGELKVWVVPSVTEESSESEG
jgi:large subunit ribosomal protein L9